MNRFLLLVAAAALLGGCANVKAYQKGDLAERAMQLDPDPITSAYNDHTYFSIEASSGGRGFGGGGCGCN